MTEHLCISTLAWLVTELALADGLENVEDVGHGLDIGVRCSKQPKVTMPAALSVLQTTGLRQMETCCQEPRGDNQVERAR